MASLKWNREVGEDFQFYPRSTSYTVPRLPVPPRQPFNSIQDQLGVLVVVEDYLLYAFNSIQDQRLKKSNERLPAFYLFQFYPRST